MKEAVDNLSGPRMDTRDALDRIAPVVCRQNGARADG